MNKQVEEMLKNVARNVKPKNELKKVILFDNLPNFEKIAKVIVKGGFTVEIKHAK